MMCQFLVKSGARLNEFSSTGYSELYYAKDTQTLEELVKLGTDLEAVNIDGNTNLTLLSHDCCSENEEKRVRLRRLGAKVHPYKKTSSEMHHDKITLRNL